ncbi:putative coiled-coil protein SlyX [Bradyrhizobium sp. USDA 3397]
MDVIDQANGSELPAVLRKSSRRLPWVFGLVAILTGLWVGGARYWPHIDTFLEASGTPETVSIPALSSEDKAILSEIHLRQQEAGEELTALNRNINAQQADLQRMLDQIAVLTSRIDALQSPATAAPPPADPRPPAAHAASKAITRASRPSKPEGPVSVGGAPLASEVDRR